MEGTDRLKEYCSSIKEFASEQKHKIGNAIQKEKELRKLDDVVKSNDINLNHKVEELWSVIDKMDIQINALEDKIMRLEQRIEELEHDEV